MNCLTASTRNRLRAVFLVALAITVGASLVSCSATPESTALRDRCNEHQRPGAVDAVRVTGEFGQQPQLDFPRPLRVPKQQMRRTGTGSGDPITPNGLFEGTFTLFDGLDGRVVLKHAPLSLNGRGEAAPITQATLTDDLPGLAEIVRCAHAGERIIAAMPGEAFASGHSGTLTGNMPATVIAIVDILRVYPSGASGTALPPTDGFPAVVTAPSGQPGITVPKHEPPDTMRATVTVQGYGPAVRPGDRLTLHLSVHSWATGELLGSTRTPGAGIEQPIAKEDGWNDGLYGAVPTMLGHGVGSQIVTIVPSEQVGTITGPVRGSRISGESLVLVIDVLAADPITP